VAELYFGSRPDRPGRIAHLTRLRKLCLGTNRIGDEGVVALADSTNVSQLTYLEITRNQLTDVSARALIRSPHLGRLRELHLRGNQFSEEGKVLLQERFGSRLTV